MMRRSEMTKEMIIASLKEYGYKATFEKVFEEEKTSKFRTCFGDSIKPEDSAAAMIDCALRETL